MMVRSGPACAGPVFFDNPPQDARRPPRCRATTRRLGGKSELRRAVRRVTPGQGDLKESGTEKIPPRARLPGRVQARPAAVEG